MKDANGTPANCVKFLRWLFCRAENTVVFVALARFSEQVELERYGSISVLGMSEPVR